MTDERAVLAGDSPIGLAAWLLDHNDADGQPAAAGAAALLSWTEKAYPKLIYYNKLDKGGHFAAWEQPPPRSARRSDRCASCWPGESSISGIVVSSACANGQDDAVHARRRHWLSFIQPSHSRYRIGSVAKRHPVIPPSTRSFTGSSARRPETASCLTGADG